MKKEFEEIRNRGKELFSQEKYIETIYLYKDTLKLSLENSDLAILFVNISLCYYKLSNFNKVVKYASKALDLDPSNVKAMYRRSLGNEKLENYEQAIEDAKKLLTLNPSDPTYIRLMQDIIKKAKLSFQNNNPLNVFTHQIDCWLRGETVNQEILFKMASNTKIRKNIFSLNNIRKLLKSLHDSKLSSFSLKLLCCYIKNDYEHTKFVCDNISLNNILNVSDLQFKISLSEFVYLSIENFVNNYKETHVPPCATETYHVKFEYKNFFSTFLEQHIQFSSYFNIFKDILIPYDDLSFLLNILFTLNKILKLHDCVSIFALKNGVMTPILRCLRYFDVGNKDFWSNFDNFLPIIDSITLSFENLFQPAKYDFSYRKIFFLNIDHELGNFSISNPNELLKSLLILSPLMNADPDILSFVMIESENKYGESIVNAFCDQTILSQSISLFTTFSENLIGFVSQVFIKTLDCIKFKPSENFFSVYKSFFDFAQNSSVLKIQVIGLLGLTKYSVSPFAKDNPVIQYYSTAKMFLLNSSLNYDELKVLEVIAFLTLNPEVKEALIRDENILKCLFSKTLEICSSLNQAKSDQERLKNFKLLPLLLCSVSILANLASIKHPDRIKQDVDFQGSKKELKQLASACGQPPPKKHSFEKKNAVKNRIQKLATSSFYSLLYNIVQSLKYTSSETQKEINLVLSQHTPYYVAELYYESLLNPEVRVNAVQSGAVKSLLILCSSLKIGVCLPSTGPARSETPFIAAHALSLIAISINPVLCFKEQREFEAVQPLLCIADFDQCTKRRFDSLMALTNIFSHNENIREYFTDLPGGFQVIETAIFDDNLLIRTAGIELTTNLLMSSYFIEKYFLMENFVSQQSLPIENRDRKAERVRMFVLLSGELNEEKLSSAAAGGLALMSHYPKLCLSILDVSSFFEIINLLLNSENSGLVHRSCYILKNMATHGPDYSVGVQQNCLINLQKITLTEYENPEMTLKLHSFALETINLLSKHSTA